MPENRRKTTAVAIELQFPNGGALGPEDIALIDMIRKERSIIGASRALGLSYRKCWLTADALNRCFESPIIATYPGAARRRRRNHPIRRKARRALPFDRAPRRGLGAQVARRT